MEMAVKRVRVTSMLAVWLLTVSSTVNVSLGSQEMGSSVQVLHVKQFLCIYNQCSFFTPDIDECEGQSPCHINAQCQNTVGSFSCTCMEGYVGDGRGNCHGTYMIMWQLYTLAMYIL